MEVAGDPIFPRDISYVQVLNERKQRFEGPEKVVLADLLEFIKVHDPDVILFSCADTADRCVNYPIFRFLPPFF
ncbi:Uncharacterised protein [uncultured archaeon]|nr:Uncharacterised protein [uncultured archaeon]